MTALRLQTLGTAIAIVVASWSPPALAIDDSSRAAARALINEGADLFDQGRYVEARRKFLDAYAVVKVPTVAVWAARANEKIGKLVAASELYENALLMQPNDLWVGNVQQQAQEQAQEELKTLKPRIPTLKINLVGATASEVEVTVDNSSVPPGLLLTERPTEPGSHVVTVTRGGQAAAEAVITLAEAEKKIITLEVPAATSAAVPLVPPVAPTTTPVAGVGAVGAPGVPATTSPAAVQPAPIAQPQWVTQTPATQNPVNTASPESSSVRTARTVGWVGIGVGAAGVALGITGAIVVVVTRATLHSNGCTDTTCVGNRFNSTVDNYNLWRTLSTVGFVVGGVSAATGLTLLLTNPKQESAPNVGLLVGPGAVSLKGDF